MFHRILTLANKKRSTDKSWWQNRYLHLSVKFKNISKNMSQCMRFLTMWHFDIVDSDKPLQPPCMLRKSELCSVSSLTIMEYSSD